MHWSESVNGATPGTADGRPPARARAFTELERVTLGRPVESEDGLVPAGTSGTIMHVYSEGSAYEVEFTEPFSTVATVKADEIASLPA